MRGHFRHWALTGFEYIGMVVRSFEATGRFSIQSIILLYTFLCRIYSIAEGVYIYEILHLATLGVKPLGAHIRGTIIM